MVFHIDPIADIVGNENCFTDHASRLAASRAINFSPNFTPEFLPLAIAAPTHMSQLPKLLNYCSEHKIPLTFRGMGLQPNAASTPACKDSIMIVTSNLRRIWEPDLHDHVVKVQSGADCKDIVKLLAKHGLCCPPLNNAAGTIGGVIAVNRAGAGYAAYGSIANYIDKLEVFTTDGNKLMCNAANNLPGGMGHLAVSPQLFCGSMGAFVFIGDCHLRVLPLPSTRHNYLLEFDACESALQFATNSMQNPQTWPAYIKLYDPVCASCLLDRPQNDKWLLFMEYENTFLESRAHLPVQCPSFATITELPGNFELAESSLLPTLLAKHGEFLLEALLCPPSLLKKFTTNILAILKKYFLQAALYSYPEIAAVYLALFQGQPDLHTAIQELKSLELMANQLMTNENESQMPCPEGLAAFSNELLKHYQKFCDPTELLAAHRRVEKA